jgi:hypothetical protein
VIVGAASKEKLAVRLLAAATVALAFAVAAAVSSGMYFAIVAAPLAVAALVFSLLSPSPRRWRSWAVLIASAVVSTLAMLYFAIVVWGFVRG